VSTARPTIGDDQYVVAVVPIRPSETSGAHARGSPVVQALADALVGPAPIRTVAIDRLFESWSPRWRTP
jgi:hypothetical protein